MTDIGEGIAITLIRLEEDKCVFCGKKHKEQKKDKIQPTEWKRKGISGVGGNFAGEKKALYPGNQSPPSAYRSEGHHCLAFSAFIVDARKAPKDRFAALNHYLKEKGYDPNNDNNTIDLPGRKKKGDTDDFANYKEYEKAVLEKKPLQLHIGGHAKEFLSLSNIMLRDIVNGLVDRGMCEEVDDTFKEKLKEKVVKAEDRAFKLTASAKAPWIAHPGPLKEAEQYVKEKNRLDSINYPKM